MARASTRKKPAAAQQAMLVQGQPSRVFIDVSDFLNYFFYHMSASGIQRVVMEMIRHYLVVDSGAGAVFVIRTGATGGFFVAGPSALKELLEGIDNGSFTRPTLSALVRSIHDAATEERIAPGDVFFVPGAFWASPSCLCSAYSAKAQGARVGMLCHDLIPVREPEYCDAGLAAIFQTTLGFLIELCDFVLGTSQQVVNDITAYLAERGRSLPVTGVALADQIIGVRQTAAVHDAPELRPEVERLTTRPFVLIVSTIEVRKNHIFSLLVWQRLLAARLPDVPDLVWVGRPGWLVEDLMQRVQRLDHLGGRLTILNNLSDAELAVLYRHCWMTMMPSLSEGWGLPVSESLMFGKPAAVSDIPTFQEVGRGFVWHFDPHDIPAGVALMTRLIQEPSLVDTAAERIRTSFVPRPWSAVGADMAAGIARLAARASIASPLPEFTPVPGEIVSAGLLHVDDGTPLEERLAIPSRDAVAVESLFDDGWYVPERWGRWLKGSKGSLRLPLPPRDDPSRHIIHIRLTGFAGWTGTQVSIFSPEAGTGVIATCRPGTTQSFSFELDLPRGDNTLVLWAEGEDQVSEVDIRKLSIGLTEFALAPLSDEAACEILRERCRETNGTVLTAGRIQRGGAPPATPLLQRPTQNRTLAIRSLREGPRLTLARVFRRLAIWLER